MKGWEKAGVAGVARGETSLTSEDPIKDIDSAHSNYVDIGQGCIGRDT